jgi:hypothetical protein
MLKIMRFICLISYICTTYIAVYTEADIISVWITFIVITVALMLSEAAGEIDED